MCKSSCFCISLCWTERFQPLVNLQNMVPKSSDTCKQIGHREGHSSNCQVRSVKTFVKILSFNCGNIQNQLLTGSTKKEEFLSEDLKSELDETP